MSQEGGHNEVSHWLGEKLRISSSYEIWIFGDTGPDNIDAASCLARTAGKTDVLAMTYDIEHVVQMRTIAFIR